MKTGCIGTSPGICEVCPRAHYPDVGGRTCILCPAGHTCVDGCKRPIPAGLACSDDSWDISCAAGWPPLETCGSAASWCIEGERHRVTVGHYTTCMGGDAVCPGTKRSAQEPCPVGHACVDGIALRCGPGEYQNTTGKAMCAKVTVGYYLDITADGLYVAQHKCEEACVWPPDAHMHTPLRIRCTRVLLCVPSVCVSRSAQARICSSQIAQQTPAGSLLRWRG